MLLSILGFLIILGPLVIVHEFGHYFFARLFNVKAEIFSIGFGPRLWSRQVGETNVRVSAFPLGGYVKLLGEERDVELKPEDQARALHRQAPWKRFFIFFGGPCFNFLFAILVFMAILAIGEPQVANVIGRVVEGSPAQKAGFMSGDRVLSANGKRTRKFEDIVDVISDSPNQPVTFEVIHPVMGQPRVKLTATPKPEEGYTMYGEATQVGEIEGLMPAARAPQVGVSDPKSPAGQAGVQTGDLIIELNGQPLQTWEQFASFYRGAPVKTKFSLKLKGADPHAQAKSFEFTKAAPGEDLTAATGLRSTELFVDKPVEKSPAEAAGLKHGDRLIGVGNQTVNSFFELRDAVQHAGETAGKIDLHWEHDGKLVSALITPTATGGRDPLLKKTTQYTVGVIPMVALAEPEMVIERILNPFKLLYKGSERMVLFSWRNFVSIRKMFTGDVSVATLGGPIMIGKIAGESISRGLIAFLTTMAMLSIGLGVLNVLPVPVLDGGHLLLLAVEAIRGKPLTLRTMEIVQGVGLSALLLLMGLVMKNDITRLPFFN